MVSCSEYQASSYHRSLITILQGAHQHSSMGWVTRQSSRLSPMTRERLDPWTASAHRKCKCLCVVGRLPCTHRAIASIPTAAVLFHRTTAPILTVMVRCSQQCLILE